VGINAICERIPCFNLETAKVIAAGVQLWSGPEPENGKKE
jgi:hypothetical protein